MRVQCAGGVKPWAIGSALTANPDGSFTLTVHTATAATDLAGLTTTPAASFEGSIPFSVAVDRKGTPLDSSTTRNSYAVSCFPQPETPGVTPAPATINDD